MSDLVAVYPSQTATAPHDAHPYMGNIRIGSGSNSSTPVRAGILEPVGAGHDNTEAVMQIGMT
jgi:hypothetical protein